MIFSRPTSDQALALAGVFQSAELVDQLARYGDITDAHLSSAMTTLLNQNPVSVLDLYDATDNLELGVKSLRTMLSDRTKGSADVMRYVIGIMYLSRRLITNQEKIAQVASGIALAQQQAEHFSPSHDNVIANVAGLYTETVSTMQGRIQVSGDPLYLTQASIAQRVRCVLFSGIRSAFLWHQVGGKRSHLLLQRRRLMAVLPK